MSDPFANLFSSFKGDTGQPLRQSTKNSSLNELLDRRSPTLSPSITPSTDYGEQRSISTVENKMTSHSELLDAFLAGDTNCAKSSTKNSDDQFGLDGTDTVHVNSTVSEVVKDELDMVFETIHSESLKPNVSLDGIQDEAVVANKVDEVMDMEIARLMSLGLSIDQATEYYVQGLLYEDVLARMKRTNSTRNSTNSTSFFDNELDNPFNVSSLASNLYSLGKGFIEGTLRSKERTDSLKVSYASEITNRSQYNNELSSVKCQNTTLSPKADNLSRADWKPKKNYSSGTFSNRTPADVKITPISTHLQNSGDNSKRSSLFPLEGTLVDFDGEDTLDNSSRASLSNIQKESFDEFKNKGIQLFKTGDYSGALSEFQKSLNSIPSNHPLGIISLSNIIACQSRLGEYSNGLESISLALELLGVNIYSDSTIANTTPHKTYKQMAFKIQTKHAEILESMENYEKALEIYNKLLDNNLIGANILAGKRRCEKIVHPEKFKAQPNKTSRKSPSVASRADTSSAASTSNAVKIVEQRNKEILERENERVRLHEIVEEKIRTWSHGHELDLRYLLSNVSSLLHWTDWKPVSSSDLVLPKKVKISYLKAISRTHPDKLPSNMKTENIMVAENVFMILNKAWEHFKEENKL